VSDQQKHQNPHHAEKKQVAEQAGIINKASRVVAATPFAAATLSAALGRSNFEGHDLNAMIDLVETARPEDLETAGTALWNAKDAIEKAAEELKGHIGRVEWEGETATAFYKWGENLVKHALELAAFAGVTGTQITAAATGLASVRTAMPPRDSRLVPKTVDQIPTHMQVEGNKEYAAAVKAEKDRQEAINQMNRLASFYAVSEEVMAGQEPPTFEPMPDVGVPKPERVWDDEYPGDKSGSGGLGSSREPSATGHRVAETVVQARPEDIPPPHKPVDDSISRPDVHVGTKIDSVGTLSPQETPRQSTNVAPTVTGPSGGIGGTVSPLPVGTVPRAPSGLAGRTSGFGGANGNRPAPVSAQGRTGTPNGTVGGRGSGPMGHATTSGQSGTRGGSASPVGRGVSGGMPRTVGGPASDRAGGASSTGAARGNGVVGGRPATGPQGPTGSRVPRGTVVGAEGNTGSRTPAGQSGQRGVIGAPNSTPGTRPGQTARPPASNADGVVGMPKGRTQAVRSGGLAGVGGSSPHRRTGDRRNTNRGDREGESQPETPQRNAPE
jgi:hypothetical protein